MEDEDNRGEIWFAIFGQDWEAVNKTAWDPYLYFRPLDLDSALTEDENEAVTGDRNDVTARLLMKTRDCWGEAPDMIEEELSPTTAISSRRVNTKGIGKTPSRRSPVKSSVKPKRTPTAPEIPVVQRPFSVDMSSVKAKMVETAQVADLLEAVFTENETPAALAAPIAEVPQKSSTSLRQLDNQHYVFVRMLAQKSSWAIQEVTHLATSLGLMTGGALERVNDMAWEACGEPITEGDDPVEVNTTLIEELLK